MSVGGNYQVFTVVSFTTLTDSWIGKGFFCLFDERWRF